MAWSKTSDFTNTINVAFSDKNNVYAAYISSPYSFFLINPVTKTVTQKNNLPFQYDMFIGSGDSCNRVYTFIASNSLDNSRTDFYYYNSVNDTWTALPYIPCIVPASSISSERQMSGSYLPAVGCEADDLYVAGGGLTINGQSGNQYGYGVWKFSGGTWTCVAELPNGIYGGKIIYYNGYLYIFGTTVAGGTITYTDTTRKIKVYSTTGSSSASKNYKINLTNGQITEIYNLVGASSGTLDKSLNLYRNGNKVTLCTSNTSDNYYNIYNLDTETGTKSGNSLYASISNGSLAVSNGSVFVIKSNNAIFSECNVKYIIKDGSTWKNWNGTAFDVITAYSSQEALAKSGFADVTTITKSALDTLSSTFNVYCTYLPTMNIKQLKLMVAPKPSVAKMVTPISFSALNKLCGIKSTSIEGGNGTLRYALSVDCSTWKSYKSGTWTTVTITDMTNFKTNGMTTIELNGLGKTQLDTIMGTGTNIYIAVYFEELDAVNDNCEIDKLEFQFVPSSYETYPEVAIAGIDYRYGYPNATTIRFNLLRSGDWIINTGTIEGILKDVIPFNFIGNKDNSQSNKYPIARNFKVQQILLDGDVVPLTGVQVKIFVNDIERYTTTLSTQSSILSTNFNLNAGDKVHAKVNGTMSNLSMLGVNLMVVSI